MVRDKRQFSSKANRFHQTGTSQALRQERTGITQPGAKPDIQMTTLENGKPIVTMPAGANLSPTLAGLRKNNVQTSPTQPLIQAKPKKKQETKSLQKEYPGSTNVLD